MTQLNQGRTGSEQHHSRKSGPRQTAGMRMTLASVFSSMLGVLVGFFGDACFSANQIDATSASTCVCSTPSITGGVVHLPKHTKIPFGIQEPTTPTRELEPTSGATLETTFCVDRTPKPLSSFFMGSIICRISYNDRPLKAYRLGHGESSRAIVGGIHGGHKCNTVVLVSDTFSCSRHNHDEVRWDSALHVIPCACTDGLAAETAVLAGRMNARGVNWSRN